MRNVIALVLGGGRGTRLYPLTKYRAKPAVPLAAKYRLIDIPLSNCLNSGINRVYVLTQFLSVSLHRHLRQTYRFDQFSGGFVELLAAQQTMETGTEWYQGTADAVRKNFAHFKQPDCEYVLILSGDQLYQMDYREMLETHIRSKADVTIGAIPCNEEAARGFGVMRIDESGRVLGFLEKPKTPEELNSMRMDPNWIDERGLKSKGREFIASMGIYIFNRKTLTDVLSKTDYHDFGKEVFPACIRSRNVQVHLFDGYWEDIGTIKAFYRCNLELLQNSPPFQFGDPKRPIYTRARFLPPSMVFGAQVNCSMIAEGCKIGRGAVIENSIIGLRTVIGEGVTIRDSIIMGADYYDDEVHQRDSECETPVGIGAGTFIQGAIIDKNCRVGRNVRIVNETGMENTPNDADDCLIRDGIPVLVKDARIPDGWRL
jgi:glucose-1-phosphate adenylyltransferase